MIDVCKWGPAVSITVPLHALNPGAYAHGIVLTRDEAFDLLDKLRRMLADDTPEGKASQRQSVARGDE